MRAKPPAVDGPLASGPRPRKANLSASRAIKSQLLRTSFRLSTPSTL